MALKKDNLPVNVDVDTEQGSSITYANEVVAIIAGVAASEVEGIAGMCNVTEEKVIPISRLEYETYTDE